VLVDCGLYQGLRELRERNWVDLPVPAASIDAVVLTHAHIDHCGYLPRLVAQGFEGPAYATRRTDQLARIVLPDCGYLNEEEAEYANRKGYSRHDPALPLYTRDDALVALEHLVPVEYGATLEVAPDVSVRLSRAGHILGAASIGINIANGATTVVSGDLGRGKHPFLTAPDPCPPTDFVLVESTYGDRRHDDGDAIGRLADVILETLGRGGSVLIPAFAVDRTEVILYHLAELVAQGRLPADVPVFVDSPMALSALNVYRQAIADGDVDIRPEFHGVDPFGLPNLEEVHDVEGSKALNHPARPSIVISAAGMASGGRVVHHLASALPDRRNTIVLVGYQAAGTRGRQLIDGATELKMIGKYVPVRAQVVDLPQFSVHADRDELLQWVGSSPREPQTVFVVHGESTSSRALATSIRDSLDWLAVVPKVGERVRLDR
jgi:metallo-beta-lactamase family protein